MLGMLSFFYLLKVLSLEDYGFCHFEGIGPNEHCSDVVFCYRAMRMKQTWYSVIVPLGGVLYLVIIEIKCWAIKYAAIKRDFN